MARRARGRPLWSRRCGRPLLEKKREKWRTSAVPSGERDDGRGEEIGGEFPAELAHPRKECREYQLRKLEILFRIAAFLHSSHSHRIRHRQPPARKAFKCSASRIRLRSSFGSQ